MDTHIYKIPMRVLIYREGKDFVAHGLEVDLIGCGSTEKEALAELKGAIDCQITFAHQMGDPGLIGHSAEKSLFDRWDEANEKALKSIACGDVPLKMKVQAKIQMLDRAATLEFDPKTLKSRKPFSPTEHNAQAVQAR